MSDAIDQAIAATESALLSRRLQVSRVLRTGRAAVLDIPADLGVGELLELVSFVASELPGEIVKAAEPESAAPIVAVRRPHLIDPRRV